MSHSFFWVSGRSPVGRAILLLLLLIPLSASAEQEWETSIYKGWTVTSVEVRGLDGGMASDIEKGLALAAKSGLLRSQHPEFYPQTLADDVRRCVLFLARHGYPYAVVSPRVEPAKKNRQVRVVFEIDKGPPVRITNVVLLGFPPDLLDDARDAVTLEEGRVFTDARLVESVEAVGGILAESGYARATVGSRIGWKDSTAIEITVDVLPGNQYYFGDVRISGAEEDLIPLIRKSVTADHGALFSPKALDDSRRNLRVLGVFRQVQVLLDADDAAPDTVDVVVDVIMREHRTIEGTVRLWTDENLDAAGKWEHRNLFKRGRGGRLEVSELMPMPV